MGHDKLKAVSVSLYSAQSRSPQPTYTSSRNYCPAQTKQDQALQLQIYCHICGRVGSAVIGVPHSLPVHIDLFTLWEDTV